MIQIAGDELFRVLSAFLAGAGEVLCLKMAGNVEILSSVRHPCYLYFMQKTTTRVSLFLDVSLYSV